MNIMKYIKYDRKVLFILIMLVFFCLFLVEIRYLLDIEVEYKKFLYLLFNL